MTIRVGSIVWVKAAFLDDIGEPPERVTEEHRVMAISETDVKLDGFDAWIPIRACCLVVREM